MRTYKRGCWQEMKFKVCILYCICRSGQQLQRWDSLTPCQLAHTWWQHTSVAVDICSYAIHLAITTSSTVKSLYSYAFQHKHVCVCTTVCSANNAIIIPTKLAKIVLLWSYSNMQVSCHNHSHTYTHICMYIYVVMRVYELGSVQFIVSSFRLNWICMVDELLLTCIHKHLREHHLMQVYAFGTP